MLEAMQAQQQQQQQQPPPPPPSRRDLSSRTLSSQDIANRIVAQIAANHVREWLEAREFEFEARDDDESGALKIPNISSETIKNSAEAFKHLTTAGTNIAK